MMWKLIVLIINNAVISIIRWKSKQFVNFAVKGNEQTLQSSIFLMLDLLQF